MKCVAIKGVKTYPDGRQVCDKSAAGLREYRYRTMLMFERQMGRCALCLMPMRLELCSYDHADGRGGGGFRRDDRIEVEGRWQNAAVCWPCNSDKGSRRIPYLIQQPALFTKNFEELITE